MDFINTNKMFERMEEKNREVDLRFGLFLNILLLVIIIITVGAVHFKNRHPNIWKTSDDDIEFLEELGHGNFGSVYRGTWRGNVYAMKTMIPGKMNQDDLIQEAKIMAGLKHKNIVQCYGIKCKDENPVILLEHCDRGSLDKYLKDQYVSINEKLEIAMQIAEGMDVLERCRIVHRDLAARNILLVNDPQCHCMLTPKVADFGLARRMYGMNQNYAPYFRTGKLETLPTLICPTAKWTGEFTSKSDVYSFGVLIRELFNTPPDYFFPCPDSPPEVLHLMQRCLHPEPLLRPTFTTIVTLLALTLYG